MQVSKKDTRALDFVYSYSFIPWYMIHLTYISEFFVPSAKDMAFERDREVILWDPVVEDFLHFRIVWVNVEHEAVETLPPLNVVHKGDLLPVGALEDGLGALYVVHHVLAGGKLGLVESITGSFICRNMSCADDYNWKCLSGTTATKMPSQMEVTLL